MLSSLSTWQDIRNSNIKVVFLPIGSLEQHGAHLPLCTDTLISVKIIEVLVTRLKDCFVLPPLPFSNSYEHAGFPGSVSLKVKTLNDIVSDILESIEYCGINKLVIVTGHMGNHFLRNVVQELNISRPRVLLLPNVRHWSNAYIAAGLESTPSSDMHAGEGETSILMSIDKNYVITENIFDTYQPSRPLLEVLGFRAYTNNGCIGFPSLATDAKGTRLISCLVDELEPIVKEFVDIGQKK